MEPRRNPCLLPSNAPVLGRLDSSKRVFQVTSGNLQSSDVDNVDARAKVSSDGQVTSKCLPPSTELVPTADRLDNRKRQRVRKARDNTLPILSQEQLNSQKYVEYRDRQRKKTGENGEPVWPDDLEEAFQRGLLPCYEFYTLPRLTIGSSTGNSSLWTQEEDARRQSKREKRTDRSLNQTMDGQRPVSQAGIKSYPSAQALHEG